MTTATGAETSGSPAPVYRTASSPGPRHALFPDLDMGKTAAAFGISHSHLCKLLSFKRHAPTLHTIRLLSLILNRTADEVMALYPQKPGREAHNGQDGNQAGNGQKRPAEPTAAAPAPEQGKGGKKRRARLPAPRTAPSRARQDQQGRARPDKDRTIAGDRGARGEGTAKENDGVLGLTPAQLRDMTTSRTGRPSRI